MRIGIVDHRKPRWKDAITASYSRFTNDLFDIPHSDPSRAASLCASDTLIVVHSDAIWQWIEALVVLENVKRVVVVSDDEIPIDLQSRLRELVRREDWLVFSSVCRFCLAHEHHRDRATFLADLGKDLLT